MARKESTLRPALDFREEFQSWLESMDLAIRESRFSGLLQALKQRHVRRGEKELFRHYSVEVAKIYRRLAAPQEAIKILFPIVRDERKSIKDVPASARAEYAVALLQVGAESEAQQILDDIIPHHYPEALLYSAFVSFRRWEYKKSIKPLERYIEMMGGKNGDLYSQLIGQVNLSAALVGSDQFDLALKGISKALDSAERKNYRLLQGNLLEIQSQAFISLEQWKNADASLKKSRELNVNASPLLDLIADKWSCFKELKKRGFLREIAGQFVDLRERAAKLKHYETLRQLDLYEATATQSQTLFEKLYFGTPYEGYRTMLEKRFKKGSISCGQFDYQMPGDQQKKAKPILDLRTGHFESDIVKEKRSKRKKLVETIKAGQITHRLLLALSRDFYKPSTLGSIFEDLFTDEYFSPVKSPNHVHQAILRARRDLKKKKIPLLIEESLNRYSLSASSDCTLRLGDSKNNFEGFDKKIGVVQLSWTSQLQPGTFYSIRDLIKVSGLCRRTLFLRLKEAGQMKLIIKHGQGKKTTYLLADSSTFQRPD